MVCERAFLPDERAASDRGALARERPAAVATFDVVAFSISFETDYLHLRRHARRGRPRAAAARARGGRDPLLVVGGPATFLNPEPIADFFDLFLIGEGEEMIPEFLAALRAARRSAASATRCCDASATVAGAYRAGALRGGFAERRHHRLGAARRRRAS